MPLSSAYSHVPFGSPIPGEVRWRPQNSQLLRAGQEASQAVDSSQHEFLVHLGACQNYGPLLGTLNIRCRIIIRTRKGTLILTTTHLVDADHVQKALSAATLR